MGVKTGVLGFGVVGKSYLRFLSGQGKTVSVWDNRELSADEVVLLRSHGAFQSKQDLEQFVEEHDQVFVSPGIALESSGKLRCELDLFSVYFKKPVIAITGTLGKTSVTKILEQLLNACGIRAKAGGNIGYAMLDLIEKQEEIDVAVLELSSFQLELNKSFAPKIGILSNFYPNHLDRHGTMKDYLAAKLKLFEYQSEDQIAIFPSSLAKHLKAIKAQKYFVGGEGEQFVVKDNFFTRGSEKFNMSLLPRASFQENWLLGLAVLSAFGVCLERVEACISGLKDEEIETGLHRLELFANIKGVDFYNDSKATVIEATLAALQKLDEENRPIILILGGLGKGVDRSWAMDSITKSKNIKKIICLGDTEFGCESYENLEDLVAEVMRTAEEGDQVLFSPGGTSFDLFRNFRERGASFKKLVTKYGAKEKFFENQSSNLTGDC